MQKDETKSAGAASDLSGLLGFDVKNIEVKYTDSQQELIDMAEKNLREYDEIFTSKLIKNGESIEKTRHLLLSDSLRILLVNRIVYLRTVMIPSYIIKT